MRSIALPVISWKNLRPGPELLTWEGALPLALRRRVDPLGRMALAAAWSLAPDARTRYVFSSRHGEYSRTFSLLNGLIDENAVSPASFSLAVHHALAGLLSMSLGDVLGHTAVAAGRESFPHALLEAGVYLRENPHHKVLLVHYDEPLPPLYHEILEQEEAFSVTALLLGGEGNHPLELGWRRKEPPTPPSPSPALEFIAWLASNRGGGQAHGEHRTWWWRHVDPV